MLQRNWTQNTSILISFEFRPLLQNIVHCYLMLFAYFPLCAILFDSAVPLQHRALNELVCYTPTEHTHNNFVWISSRARWTITLLLCCAWCWCLLMSHCGGVYGCNPKKKQQNSLVRVGSPPAAKDSRVGSPPAAKDPRFRCFLHLFLTINALRVFSRVGNPPAHRCDPPARVLMLGAAAWC